MDPDPVSNTFIKHNKTPEEVLFVTERGLKHFTVAVLIDDSQSITYSSSYFDQNNNLLSKEICAIDLTEEEYNSIKDNEYPDVSLIDIAINARGRNSLSLTNGTFTEVVDGIEHETNFSAKTFLDFVIKDRSLKTDADKINSALIRSDQPWNITNAFKNAEGHNNIIVLDERQFKKTA